MRSRARSLHPVAWWVWALGLAAAASMTTNPLLLLLLVSGASVVVLARRGDQPWARSFRLYLALGLAIVVIRVLFRILLGGVDQGTVVLDLPEVPLPDWAAGVRLLGPLTREALLAGLYDGMRLAAIVVCVGAANSLANPKRLLASLPPALYEVGTALVVAVTIFPQLADSLRRVRAAQALRGGPSGRLVWARRTVVPVLEDALERSLALAAGMDVRGYGRAGDATPAERRLTGALLLGALVGIGVGVYAWLDPEAPRWLADPMLVAGLVLAGVGILAAGRRVRRTRYRPDTWQVEEVLVAASGLLAAVLVYQLRGTDPLSVYADVASVPYLTLVGLLAGVVGSFAAVLAPPAPGSAPASASAPDAAERSRTAPRAGAVAR